jgi:hypothetical protein
MHILQGNEIHTNMQKMNTEIETNSETDIEQLMEDMDEVAYSMQMTRLVQRPRDPDNNAPLTLETKLNSLPLKDDSRSWLVPLMFEGQLLMLLLDTGANVSLINAEVYKSRYPRETELLGWKGSIHHAAGEDMVLSGCFDGHFEFAESSIQFDMAVAEIGWGDGVLGMDFLNRPDVHYDVTNGILEITTPREVYRTILIRPPQRGSFIGYVEESVILPA